MEIFFWRLTLCDVFTILLWQITRGRAVAARRAHNPEVEGSNPSPATKFFFFVRVRVAQMVRAQDS